jgi:hypothetical protein
VYEGLECHQFITRLIAPLPTLDKNISEIIQCHQKKFKKSYYLGNFGTNYIMFRNAKVFKKISQIPILKNEKNRRK